MIVGDNGERVRASDAPPEVLAMIAEQTKLAVAQAARAESAAELWKVAVKALSVWLIFGTLIGLPTAVIVTLVAAYRYLF